MPVDAFEIDNELDLYCNDADSPTRAERARHLDHRMEPGGIELVERPALVFSI